MKLRYIMYLRKSTDAEDRQVQSIEDQRRELAYEVTRRGLNVVKTFGESKSAKQPGRPMYNEMMAMLKSGQADAIICWKLNRLSRNPVDGGEIQWLLQQEVMKSIITPGREYLPTDNVLMMAVELGMANQFIIDLSKDVTRGMKSKVEKGWRPGKAPIGYLNDKFGEKGNKVVFVDQERFSLVRKMWDLLLTDNYSVMQIKRIATEEWGLRTSEGKKMSVNGTYKMLNNMFYCGEFMYKSTIYQGKHKPMITKEEFDLAQTILGKKGKPRPKNKRLPFSGVIKCAECGGMIVAEEKHKKNKTTGKIKQYLYHHCSHNRRDIECHQKSIEHSALLKQVTDYLDSITIPEEFLHWAIQVLRDQNLVEEYDRNIIVSNLQDNYNSCLRRIDNLINLYISPENAKKEMITEEEFRGQKSSLVSEKGRIELEIRKTETRVDDWLDLTEKTFNFATYAKHWFEHGDFETKTHILKCIGQNFYFRDGKLSIELQKPYLTLKNGLENEILKIARVEPSVLCEDKRKNSHFQTVFSTWSGQGESNSCHQFGKLG